MSAAKQFLAAREALVARRAEIMKEVAEIDALLRQCGPCGGSVRARVIACLAPGESLTAREICQRDPTLNLPIVEVICSRAVRAGRLRKAAWGRGYMLPEADA